jgi:hypothetical protein
MPVPVRMPMRLHLDADVAALSLRNTNHMLADRNHDV